MTGRRTPLYAQHLALGARMVDFAGWEMPLHYGSQVEEHRQVRAAAGMFDVSHMTVTDIEGADARALLRRVLANDIDRTASGKALYSCMLNERGGVIDDLIAYRLDAQRYRLITNAATRGRDLEWLAAQAQGLDVRLVVREDTALLAVQGPQARDRVHAVLGAAARQAEALGPFQAAPVDGLFVSRTGYTGEDGYEILLPSDRAAAFWQALLDTGVRPAGLGARDTLRLEAGLALYGTDMDEDVSPLEAGLGWTVAWQPEDRDFIGRAALAAKRRDPALSRTVGLILRGRGVLRGHQKVYFDDREAGEITSGSYSPSLERAIALARVTPPVGQACQVEVRGRRLDAVVVKPPFVRHGKACVPVP